MPMNPRIALVGWLALICWTADVGAAPFEWREASPGDVGMSANKVEAVRKSLEAHGTSGLLIIRHDPNVCEW